MTLAPARATFERDAQMRTTRLIGVPAAGGIGLQAVPVHEGGVMVAADISLYRIAA